MFFFDSRHDAEVEKLASARTKVVFEGLVDGKKRKIIVSVMGFTPGTGTVSFDGSGETE